jgi:hypothetical protein
MNEVAADVLNKKWPWSPEVDIWVTTLYFTVCLSQWDLDVEGSFP